MQTVYQTITDADHLLYRQWKRYGLHLLEYGSEFLGTAILMLVLVGIVSLLFAKNSPVPAHLASTHLRLFLAGLTLGGVSYLIAISPPGKLSGAHINPAFSTGMWLLGKMHARDLFGYLIAQLAGGVAGTALGVWLVGNWSAQIHDGLLWPGPHITAPAAFTAEVAATCILFFVIFTCLSHKRTLRFTPAVAMLTVAILVCLDGNVSGCGMNPARWFGPAWMTHDWKLIWVYVGGPVVGMLAAVGLRYTGVLRETVPHTGKMFHDANYRSIFRQDAAPTQLPKIVAQKISAARAPDAPRS